jgi:hypothetical protein
MSTLGVGRGVTTSFAAVFEDIAGIIRSAVSGAENSADHKV